MWDPAQYNNAIALWTRLLGLIYFIVFFPFLFQIKGLIGSNGILPAKSYFDAIYSSLGTKSYWALPSLFWFNSSDRALSGAIYLALCCSLLLLCGIGTPLMIALLYLIHLSLVYAGQDFMSFGWELFLLEIAANTFLLTITATPNSIAWISLNLLLLRFHFQGGLVKLQSGDPHWRNLTAVGYHYQSQPLPNGIAWYAHKLPHAFHRFATGAMFFIELIAPLMLFGTQFLRLCCWFLFVGLQMAIGGSGNFSYLTVLTIAFSTILLSDQYIGFLSPYLLHSGAGASMLDFPVTAAALFLLIMQLSNLWSSLCFPIGILQSLSHRLYPWHIVNRYGIFAVMTTKRYEIVIEGSDNGKDWHEYHFRYKPSEVERRPRQIAPYQPRLDWQAWFLPFSSYEREVWFQNFLLRLLQGVPAVVSLLRVNPFAAKPPRYIRALIYDYEFSDWPRRGEWGGWWKRRYIGAYSPDLQLNDRESLVRGDNPKL